MAEAEAKRSSGFFCMAFKMICSRPTGICGFNSRGGTGSLETCIIATATGLSAIKGRRPVTIS